MPLAPIDTPQFPDVPAQPGVPALFSAANQLPIQNTILAVGDVLGVLGMFAGPQWGIFTDDGFPVALADSVISVDFRREWRVSDYPLEQGAFESYDKVALPFDVRVRFAVSNTIAAPGLAFVASISPSIGSGRADFLAAVDAAAKSLDLFTVVTPDAVYPSVNIVHYDYRREARGGASLLTVDVWLEEIRANAQAQFADTAQPDGEAQQDNGTGQPQDPDPPKTPSGETVTTQTVAPSAPSSNVAGVQGAAGGPSGQAVYGGVDTKTPPVGDTAPRAPTIEDVGPQTKPIGILDQDSYKFMVQ